MKTYQQFSQSAVFAATIGLLGWALPHAGAAETMQPVTRVDFVAVDNADISSRIASRLALNLSVGAGFPNMHRINDYSAWINRAWRGTVDDIDVYTTYRVGLEYFLLPDLSLGVAGEFLDAQTDGTTHVMGAARSFEMDLETYGVVGFVRKSIQPLGDRLPVTLTGTVNVGYYWSSYVETESGYRASGDDDAWGAEVAIGLWWVPARHLAVGIEAGYRWLDFDGYGVNWVSPGSPKVEADYTGPTARLMVTAHF